MYLEYFKTVEHISVIEMCKKMSLLAEKIEDSLELLKVDVLLANGLVLSGRIVKLQEFSSMQNIWLETRNQNDTKSSITLLNCNLISGITIADFNAYLFLSEINKISRKISALELKRFGKNVEEALNKLLGKEIEVLIDNDSETHRELIYRILEQIPIIFESILIDEVSSNVVKNNIDSIKIVVTDELETNIINRILVICVKEKISNTILEDRKKLKNEIEKLL